MSFFGSKNNSGIHWDDFHVASPDGHQLALSRAHHKRHSSTVVMVPGWTSKRANSTNADMAVRLAGFGIQCVIADLSGHGDSTGDIADQTVSRAAGEISAILDALSSRKFIHPGEDVALLGNSFSGNAAILTAAGRDDLAGLVLKSPVTDYVQMRQAQLGPAKMSQWEAEGVIDLGDGTHSNYEFIRDAASVDTYGALGRVNCPMLAVHGSADADIPQRQIAKARELILASGGEHVLFAEADHGITGPYFGPCMQLFTGFLLEHLSVG